MWFLNLLGRKSLGILGGLSSFVSGVNEMQYSFKCLMNPLRPIVKVPISFSSIRIVLMMDCWTDKVIHEGRGKEEPATCMV